MGLCKFCNRSINNGGGLWAHERRCKNNPNPEPPSNNNLTKYVEKRKASNIPGENQFTKAKRLNLPTPIVTDETRQKLRASASGKIWTDDRRKKHSTIMKLAVINNPESYSANNVCGRNKQIEYNGVKLNSTWELIVIKWLNQYNIEWIRNKTGFKYYWDESDSIHTYFPDLYLPKYDRYIEVKGYETNRDRCKWPAVDNLIIIKQAEIKQIQSGLLSPHAYIVSKE